MTVVKKNQVIILALTVMIVAAGYLNFTYKDSNPYAKEITGSVGEKLGEAKLVGNEETNLDIGYAVPTSAAVNSPTTDSNTKKVDSSTESSTLNTVDQYFSETRASRENIRDQEVALQERVIANTNISTEAKEKAQQGIDEISKKFEKEMIIENLIKAKGFKDAVVFINEGNVNVVVLNGGQLTKVQAAQIQEIVTREASVAADKIKLIVK